MHEISYGNGDDLTPRELGEFYQRMRHDLAARPEQIQAMLGSSAAFVTARHDGRLVGVARGVSDGLRGYLTECKLDPAFQGPAAVTGADGRIEDDQQGIAAEMARRVLERMASQGVIRIDVLGYATEVDFLEDLGFKRAPGLVGLTMKTERGVGASAQAETVAARG